MTAEFSEHCVYTIVHINVLKKAAKHGGPTTIRESKRWVTGRQLWRQAQAAGVGFPVPLGDGTDTSQLVYWGLLTAVEFEGKVTRFTVDRVRPIPQAHKPQELTLRSTGENIAENYIKNYAICRTPDFLSKYRRTGVKASG